MQTTEALLGDLSDLLAAGVDLELSLRLLLSHRAYRGTIQTLREYVLNGRSLSSGLLAAGIGAEVQAFVQAGEATGELAGALALAASYLGRRRAVWEQAVKAGSYPIVLLLLTGLVMYLLAALVIPSFARMYAGMHIREDFSLVFLFALAHVLTELTMPLGVVLLLLAVVLAVRRKQLLDMLRASCMKLSYLRGLMQLFYSHRIIHLFAFLLQGGVDVLAAVSWLERLDIAGLGHRFGAVREGIERGDTLVEAFQQVLELAPVVFHMMSLAERTGDVATAMAHIYDYLERSRVRRQEQITRLIEPIVTLILGATVGGATLLLMLPMMDLISQLS